MRGKKKQQGRFTIGPEVQILLSIGLSLILVRLVFLLHELGPADGDNSYALAALLFLPLSLVAGFLMLLVQDARTRGVRGDNEKNYARHLLRSFWLIWSFFWIVAALLAYAF
jgi:hypothetical protein